MNTTTRLTCALAGAVALTGAFTQAASAQTRILLNCFFPPQHFICQDVLGGWAKDVTDATESRVRVAILPQTMAPPPEQLISARAGVFDAAIQMNGFIENEVVGTQVSQLPFTGVSDGRANSLALWNTYEKYLSSNDEYDGVELLGLFVAPGADFYSLTDEPIRSLEDMKSMKMWATPGATAEILKQAGSAVVAGPAVQMTELIQRGVVDGFVGIPASDAMAFNVLPSAKSATVTRLKITTPTFSFFINDDAWAKIDPADQETIRALSGAAFAERAGSIWTGIEEKALAEREEKIEVIQAPEAFEAELTAAGQTWSDKWIEAANAEGIDGSAALDFYKSEVVRLSK